MKILAVDDDLQMLELYKELLTKAGYEIETAEDPISAMAKFNNFKPDMIILDVDMPAGGGKKLFERIRQNLLSSIPIIFATAHSQLISSYNNSPNCSILKKPFTPQQLLEEIKKYNK